MSRKYRRTDPVALPGGPAEPTPGKTLTAASRLLNGRKVTRINRKATKGEPWQRDAWQLFDEIAEFSFGVGLLSEAVSKVRLVAAKNVPGFDEPEIVDGETDTDDEGEETPAPPIEIAAADLMADFAGGPEGQRAIMERAVTHLQVAGETYIVGRDTEDGQQWDCFSNEEITATGDTWKVDDGVNKFTLSSDDILIQIWLPHPMRRARRRSMTLPLLPVLSEIRALTMSISATTDSRLAGAGILFVSKSVELAGGASQEATGEENPFTAELVDAMITPIKDRDSAAAVVPIIALVPDEALGKIQHMRFESTNDLKEQEKRADAILRMARGLPISQEQILGMGDSNHWSMWGLDESLIKGPVASYAAVVMQALTVNWFRPALETEFPPELVDQYLAWFDASPLAMRPDRSAQATVALDHLMIGGEAFLRESGLDAADMPNGEEFCRLLLIKLLLVAPAQAEQWFAQLGECAGLAEAGIEIGAAPAPAEVGAGPRSIEQTPAQSDRALPEQNGAASGL